MRLRLACSLLPLLASAWAAPAHAQSAATLHEGDDWDDRTPRTVAMRTDLGLPRVLPSLDSPLPTVRSTAERPRAPLAIAGGALAGVGVLTLFAAGITWLVAAGESLKLEDECPNHRCYTGTPGGDSYETARDTAQATDVLVGIGAPVMGAGLVMLLYAAALGPSRPPMQPAPEIGLRRRGGALEMRF
jgi:hypothetical protein